MNTKQKIAISIYKIDVARFEGITEFKDIPEEIIRIHNQNEKTADYEQFKKQNVSGNNEYPGDYAQHLFYGRKVRKPRWANFVDSISEEGQEIREARNSYASFVYFLVGKKNIFAVTGGQGNFLVQGYIDDFFGLDVLSRLIDRNDRSIKTLQERGLTGSLLSASKVFRSDASFLQEDSFGKLYKQVQAGLDPVKLKSLGIESKRNASCLAKSSFKINKSVDTVSFFKILLAIEDLLEKNSKFSINKVKELKKNKNENLIIRLDEKLAENLKEAISNQDLGGFDFTHKEVDDFYSSSTYRVRKGAKMWELDEPNIQDLFRIIKSNNLIDNEAENILDELKKIRIESLDAEDLLRTRDNLLNHLHTEATLEAQNYIKIDGRWLQLTTEFVSELNEDVSAIISEISEPTLLDKSWLAEESEDQYNSKYIGTTNTYVLHKVKVDNIEISDVIIALKDKNYLVHIKKGFDTSMRELCAQVRISANYLISNKSKLSEISQKLKGDLDTKKESPSEYYRSISEQNLPQGFLEKKDNIFVLGVMDPSGRSLDSESSQFDSNIAKFELINLYKDLRAQGISLKLSQIKKDEN